MNTPTDGGPAFPVPNRLDGNAFREGQDILSYPGMSLRDWFAGQALAGMAGKAYISATAGPGPIARDVWKMADAMLAARNKEQQP